MATDGRTSSLRPELERIVAHGDAYVLVEKFS
jgi:hypothetical protein